MQMRVTYISPAFETEVNIVGEQRDKYEQTDDGYFKGCIAYHASVTIPCSSAEFPLTPSKTGDTGIPNHRS